MHEIAQNWKWVLLRGVASILFGIVALVLPELSLIALVVLYGAFAMVDGSMSIASALGAHLRDRRWVVLAGMCGVAAGFAVILYPIAAIVVLVVLIGLWALLHGIFELAAAVELHTRSQLEWWLALDGILSVFFGLLLLWRPEQGIAIVALILGIFTIVHGTLLLIFASRLSNMRTPPARA